MSLSIRGREREAGKYDIRFTLHCYTIKTCQEYSSVAHIHKLDWAKSPHIVLPVGPS